MFKYQIHALAMRKAGLGKPLGYLMLLVLIGCLVAGAIYFAVIFHAVAERNGDSHVHAHTSH